MSGDLLKYLPGIIISFSTISLAILIPILERRNKILRKKVLDCEEKISREKLNLILDSIQKSKVASIHGTQVILEELKSSKKKIFDKAMKNLSVNNLNALLKGKVNSKELYSKTDEKLIELIKQNFRINIEKVNKEVKQQKMLKESLSKLERNKFIIYISLMIIQSFGLILNQFLI